MTNEYKLIKEITSLSQSKIWAEAKLEWELEYIYFESEPETCLCGHFPIIEVCVLSNRRNKNSAIVGNVCVKKFIGLPSDNIFQAVKRIKKDEEKSLNFDAIHYAYNKKWIGDNELLFYLDIRRKRNLTSKQLNWKVNINQKVLLKINAARRLAEIVEKLKQPIESK